MLKINGTLTILNVNVSEKDLNSFLLICQMSQYRENIHKAFDRLSELIMNVAKKWIPRGKQVNFKPFWNENLSSLEKSIFPIL